MIDDPVYTMVKVSCMASYSLSITLLCKYAYLLGLPATMSLVLMITIFVGNYIVKAMKISSIGSDLWEYR